MNYRAEVDGLRALALIPVCFFHAGFEIFNGGFVGVDIFFVISGYLITTILIEDLENKSFSLIKFYQRRARRILPALFSVITTCIPFAWLWMTPRQIEEFSQSLIAVTLFSSNFLFWHKSGYFESGAEEQPLLHTWSLAVEEQYYVLFPIFLLTFWRLGKTKIFWIIVLLVVSSVILSEWGWRNSPKANFYLAPTRAWEILAGSMVAFLIWGKKVQDNNTLSFIGLALIILAIFVYDESTPFPSVYTVLPVAGVTLVLLYAGQKTLVAKLLSAKVFVGLGLISYSAYLWHFPILAFARIKFDETPPLFLTSMFLVLSLVLAIFSWKFIEQPFRKFPFGGIGKKSFVLALLTIICLTLVTGVIGSRNYEYNEFANKGQKAIMAYERYERKLVYREGECFLEPNQSSKDFIKLCIREEGSRYFIWGDSHAAALASGMVKYLPETSQRTASGCPPLLGVEITDPPRPNCKEINSANFSYLKANKNVEVILHANWKLYKFDVTKKLKQTIETLQKFGIEKITVVGGVPQYQPSLPRILVKEGMLLDRVQFTTRPQTEVRNIDKKIATMASTTNIKFLSALSILCDLNDRCISVIDTGEKFVPSAWDYGHLTLEGAIYLSQLLFN